MANIIDELDREQIEKITALRAVPDFAPAIP